MQHSSVEVQDQKTPVLQAVLEAIRSKVETEAIIIKIKLVN